MNQILKVLLVDVAVAVGKLILEEVRRLAADDKDKPKKENYR